MEQRTPQWRAARLGCISSSRVAPIISKGRAKGKTWTDAAESLAYELLAELLTGESVEIPATKAMQWGIDHEPAARRAYEAATGCKVDEAAWVPHRKEKHIGCSPDGFVGFSGLIEIKCPWTSREHLRTICTGEIPKQYMPQITHQVWLTGREWCDFVCYDPRMPEGLQLAVVRTTPDVKPHATRVIDFRDWMISLVPRIKERLRESTTVYRVDPPAVQGVTSGGV